MHTWEAQPGASSLVAEGRGTAHQPSVDATYEERFSQ